MGIGGHNSGLGKDMWGCMCAAVVDEGRGRRAYVCHNGDEGRGR